LRAFAFVGNQIVMTAGRIEQAITRIEAALTRLETARPAAPAPAPENSARVLALVDSHEKLREEVADTLRDLDALIAELEE
jgi:HAMP domain-containing protein